MQPLDSIRALPRPGALSRTPPANLTEKAARQFEEVLIREFVKTMTKDMFDGGIAGDNAPGWVKSQGDAQSDALTDAVTKQLLESGSLGIAEMLMDRWQPPTSITEEPANG